MTRRVEYLEERLKAVGATVDVNPNLESWFQQDPVERIVNIETSLITRKRDIMRSSGQESVLFPASPNSIR